MIKGVIVNEDGSFDLSQVSSAGGRYKAYERLRNLTEEDFNMDIPWEDSRYEDIKTRAWLKWQDAGCPPGDGIDFWLAAEKEYDEDHKFIGKVRIYEDPPVGETLPPVIQVEWGEPPVINCECHFEPTGYKGDSHMDGGFMSDGKGEPGKEVLPEGTLISSPAPSPLDPKEVSEVLPPWCGTSFPTEEMIIIAPPKDYKKAEKVLGNVKEEKPQNPSPPLPPRESLSQKLSRWWRKGLRSR